MYKFETSKYIGQRTPDNRPIKTLKTYKERLQNLNRNNYYTKIYISSIIF